MKFHPLAILLGIVADIVASFFDVNTSNPYLYGSSLILGLVGVAVGGYVTAIISSSSKEFNVVVFGTMEVLIALLVSSFVGAPLWFNVVSFVLIIPSALLGWYVATRWEWTRK
jgi:hypothetical protein